MYSITKKVLKMYKKEHNEVVTETGELLQIWRKYTISIFNDDSLENSSTEIRFI